MNDDKLILTTELNEEVTILTDEETVFLLEYRMADEESKKEIQKLIENLSK